MTTGQTSLGEKVEGDAFTVREEQHGAVRLQQAKVTRGDSGALSRVYWAMFPQPIVMLIGLTTFQGQSQRSSSIHTSRFRLSPNGVS